MRASYAGHSTAQVYGDLAGPLAIATCEPRQARKGATVAASYVPGCGWLDCLHSVHLVNSLA